MLLALALAAAPFAQWRAQVTTALHAPEPPPALEATSHGQFVPETGIVAERVSYRTAYGLRVPAIVYRPEKVGRSKAPALVVVNGHGGDKYAWYAFYSGILYARGGAVVLTYDPIGEGERNIRRMSGTRAHDKAQEPEEMGRRMGGLMLTDLRQAVAYLANRPDVDSRRIGAMGYSMGSFVLGIGCAVETRLRACVLVGGGNLDGPGGYWDGAKPMCQGLPYKALLPLSDRPAALYAMHADHARTLVYNGTEDSTVAIPKRDWVAGFEDLRQRTMRLAGSRTAIFEVGWSKGTAHRPYFVTRPVALFLDRVLDFPDWTQAKLLKMPFTIVGSWADRNGVEMDKLYKTPEREAGTEALGVHVPGLTRQQLSVFGAEEWERVKDSYVYESWVERARSAVSETPQARAALVPTWRHHQDIER